MRRFSETVLSPASWSVLAVATSAVALYAGLLLLLCDPSPVLVRAMFAGFGFLTMLAWRHETLLRRVPKRVFFAALGRLLAGVFGLALVTALVYPLFATARNGCQRSPATNLKMIALGCAEYTQDFDGYLPPPGTMNENRAALRPYLKDDRLWACTKKGNFVMNPVVLGHAPTDFPADSFGNKQAVLAYTGWMTPAEDGSRYVVFIDGRVKWLSEKRFQIMLRKTASQAANAALPRRELLLPAGGFPSF